MTTSNTSPGGNLDQFDALLINQITALCASTTPAAFRATVEAIQPGATGTDPANVYPAAYGILAQNARVLAGMFLAERQRAEIAERQLAAYRAQDDAQQYMQEREEAGEFRRGPVPLSPLVGAAWRPATQEEADEHAAMIAALEAGTRGDYPASDRG